MTVTKYGETWVAHLKIHGYAVDEKLTSHLLRNFPGYLYLSFETCAKLKNFFFLFALAILKLSILIKQMAQENTRGPRYPQKILVQFSEAEGIFHSSLDSRYEMQKREI